MEFKVDQVHLVFCCCCCEEIKYIIVSVRGDERCAFVCVLRCVCQLRVLLRAWVRASVWVRVSVCERVISTVTVTKI